MSLTIALFLRLTSQLGFHLADLFELFSLRHDARWTVKLALRAGLDSAHSYLLLISPFAVARFGVLRDVLMAGMARVEQVLRIVLASAAAHLDVMASVARPVQMEGCAPRTQALAPPVGG
jgi:hypothetical protein